MPVSGNVIFIVLSGIALDIMVSNPTIPTIYEVNDGARKGISTRCQMPPLRLHLNAQRRTHTGGKFTNAALKEEVHCGRRTATPPEHAKRHAVQMRVEGVSMSATARIVDASIPSIGERLGQKRGDCA